MGKPEAVTRLIEYQKLFPPEVIQSGDIFLVGGCLRDAYLQRPGKDIDLVTLTDAKLAAQKTARHLNADIYLLDAERNTWRVLASREDGRWVLDFAELRKTDLEEDLKERDFTINAIAGSLKSPDRWFDPCNGISDLNARMIRACGPQSFTSDPLRCIRALRFGSDPGFMIEKETLNSLKESIPALRSVSKERLRDELLHIFLCRRPSTGLRLMDHLGIFQQLFPETEKFKKAADNASEIEHGWRHTMSAFEGMQYLTQMLIRHDESQIPDHLIYRQARQTLRVYRPCLADTYTSHWIGDRSKETLLYWQALFHHPEKDRIEPYLPADDMVEATGYKRNEAKIFLRIGQEYKLSNPEIHRIQTGIQNHKLLHQLAKGQADSSPLGLYRLFRQYGETLLDICLLGLTDTLGQFLHHPPLDEWQRELDMTQAIFSAWYEQHAAQVDPPLLVNGEDIMQWLGINPGPEVGEILEQIREHQILREIKNREDARLFVLNNRTAQ